MDLPRGQGLPGTGEDSARSLQEIGCPWWSEPLDSKHVFEGATSCLTMCGMSWYGLFSRFKVAWDSLCWFNGSSRGYSPYFLNKVTYRT